jgi:flagellar hook-length control protein FliK
VTSDAANLIEAIDPDSGAATAAAPAPGAASVVSHAAAANAVDALVPEQPRPPQAPASVAASPVAAPLAPEVHFAEDNHPNIVAGIRGQLLPSGGTMHIRLDPPELGPLQVTIRLHDGVMEASFETSSDQASKLLSHSLSTLKTSLESQGVNVERLHVQQAPRDQQAGSNEREQQQEQNRDPQQQHAARQDQQRREMLRRMWRKLTGAEDPLDMVA